MIASEFAFLALGLGLGAVIGVGLSIVIRTRPPAAREIRMTVVPDAIPRRPAATLSGAERGSGAVGVRGGPASPEVLAGNGGATHAVPVMAALPAIPGAMPIAAVTVPVNAEAAVAPFAIESTPAVAVPLPALIPVAGPGPARPEPVKDPYEGIRIARHSRRMLVAVPMKPTPDALLASLAAIPAGAGPVERSGRAIPDRVDEARPEDAIAALTAVRVPAVAVPAAVTAAATMALPVAGVASAGVRAGGIAAGGPRSGAIYGAEALPITAPVIPLATRPVVPLVEPPVVALVRRPVVALVATPRTVQGVSQPTEPGRPSPLATNSPADPAGPGSTGGD